MVLQIGRYGIYLIGGGMVLVQSEGRTMGVGRGGYPLVVRMCLIEMCSPPLLKQPKKTN